MRRLGLISASALVLASCTTTLVASPIRSAVPSATSQAEAASAAPLVTAPIGPVSITHPASWRLIAGPPPVAFGYVPLAYLSSIPFAVEPCPTPEPSGGWDGCSFPVPSLVPTSVVLTIEPNGGLAAAIPPAVTRQAPDDGCLAAGGEREVVAVVRTYVVDACLRGPNLDTEEAQVRAAIASIAGAQ
jgi:hypothetical protein